MTYYTTAPHIYDGADTVANGITNICDAQGRAYRRIEVQAPKAWQQLDAYEEGNHSVLCPLRFNDLQRRRAA